MTLTRKSLTLDADRLRELAAWRGKSESAVVREVIEEALTADNLSDLLEELRDAGYGLIEFNDTSVSEDDAAE